ncbi:MAG: glycerol-3-phosphate dehydrogenase/oxidase [Bacteroidetes bacterium]|nr:glycerol-3-phosphate dehydrogenase/oxidase [Bacteroidota bacterium]
MIRRNMIEQLEANAGEWDICIIGGGATGLGTAVDAASRGFKTILLEQYDFAKGTSSRSTKLVHGGVRYLQQGNIKLVMEALHERGMLKQNAPHLVKNQKFIVPNYKWWEGAFYGIGLKVYDWMAGRLGLGSSQLLSKEETLELAPTLGAEGLRGGVVYHDGQFDDARLAIHLAMTASDEGATMLNYFKVTGLIKKNKKIAGVYTEDTLNKKKYEINAKVVINATGVFTDLILKMDNPSAENIIAPSQGAHIVLDRSFLPGDTAILVPHTDDGRVLFAVPWHNKIIVGTTDTLVDAHDDKTLREPVAMHEEVDFILQQIGKYLTKIPTRKDIRSTFAGLRPLVKADSKKTAELSRDHLITVSDTGLISVTGGKWTTYRRMAEDVINTAIQKNNLDNKKCVTNDLRIHAAKEVTDFNKPLYYYGTDEEQIKSLIKNNNALGELLHKDLPYIKAEIVWAVNQEMCMTVEDALTRRTRALLLDAQAAIESATVVAQLMASEMNKDQQWQDEQVNAFQELAKNYLSSGN